MSQSLFNLKSFSQSINNKIIMGRYIGITKVSRRGYTIGSSRERPSWIANPDTGYFRPDTTGKELDPYIAKTSQTQVLTRTRGEELWWMPDPHTGNYIPDNFVRERDAVELRSLHFIKSHKTQ